MQSQRLGEWGLSSGNGGIYPSLGGVGVRSVISHGRGRVPREGFGDLYQRTHGQQQSTEARQPAPFRERVVARAGTASLGGGLEIIMMVMMIHGERGGPLCVRYRG